MIDNEIRLSEVLKHSNAPKFDLPKHTFAYSVNYPDVPMFLALIRDLEEERAQKIRITVDSNDLHSVTFKLETDFTTCIMLANDVAIEFEGSVSLIPF